jgi:hypothetical protein
VATVLLAGGGACSDDDDAQPAPTTQATTSTTAVDRSGIALAGVPGETTSTIVEGGTAELTGSVQGPQGLVAGATVRIERLVGGREIRTDVLSGPDGRFALPGVAGGRYRVRAFLAPSLVQLEPEVRFLADGERHDFELVMEAQGGLVVRADVAPEPPLLGRAVNLVATVATRSVGDDGIVRSTPVVGVTVELSGLGRWSLRDDEGESSTSTTFGPVTSTTSRSRTGVARTDSGGRVRYELRCADPGDPGLFLRVPMRVAAPPTTPTGGGETTTSTTAGSSVTVESVDLDLPNCVDPTTLTTTTTAPLSTTTTQSP